MRYLLAFSSFFDPPSHIMATRILCLAILVATTSAQSNGRDYTLNLSSSPSFGGMAYQPNFDSQLRNGILDRLFRGKAVKVTLEESRHLTYEQQAECNNCNQPTQPPTITTPLPPPPPVLNNFGSSLFVVSCSALAGETIYLNLSPSSFFPFTWNGALQSGNGYTMNFVSGPDSNGNFMVLSSAPTVATFQTYTIRITDSLGRQSAPVFITFNIEPPCYTTSTPWPTTTTTYTSTTQEGTTDPFTPTTGLLVCDPCTGIGGSNCSPDCFECQISGGTSGFPTACP